MFQEIELPFNLGQKMNNCLGCKYAIFYAADMSEDETQAKRIFNPCSLFHFGLSSLVKLITGFPSLYHTV